MKFLITFTTFIFILGINCSSKEIKPPNWYPDNVASVYPKEHYLAFLGEGINSEIARSQAQSKLAEYFGSSIQSETSSRDFESSTNKKNLFGSEFEQKTKVKAQVNLFRIEYTDTYKDQNTYFVVAYLDRIQVGLIIRDKIATLEKERKLLEEEFLKYNSSPFSLLALYNQAIQRQKEIIMEKQFLNLLTVVPVPSNSTSTEKAYQLLQKRREILQEVTFFVSNNEETPEHVLTEFKSLWQDLGVQFVTEKTKALYNISLMTTFEPITLDNKYHNANWILSVTINGKDEFAWTWQEKGRASALNGSELQNAVASQEIKILNKKMISSFEDSLETKMQLN